MSVWTREGISWGLSVCHQAFQWKDTDKLSLESCKAIDEDRPHRNHKATLTFDWNQWEVPWVGGKLNQIHVSSQLNVMTAMINSI